MNQPIQPPRPVQNPGAPPRVAPPPIQPRPIVKDDPIALDGEEVVATPGVSKIKAFGAETAVKTHQWKRKPHVGGQGPVRVRTFHCKLSDQGCEYIDEAINHWLDEHPDIEIKFVTSNVGMFDGKFKDIALVMNVWY